MVVHVGPFLVFNLLDPKEINMNRSLITLAILCLATSLTGCVEATDSHDHDHPADESEMVTAAKAALSAFDTQENLVYQFQSEDQHKWHVYPKEDRIGIRYGNMTEAQQEATHVLLGTALSEMGEEQVAAIMALEEVVKVLEERDSTDDFRSPDKYFLAFFGEPNPKKPWGWRFEGHHVSLSFTIVGEEIAVTPMALGSNPGIVTSGPHEGLEVLKEEQAQGRALLNSFDETQLEAAWYSKDAPMEVLTGFENKEMAPLEQNTGLAATEMTAEQRALLEQLIRLTVGKMESNIAEAQMLRMIDAGGLDAMRFLWMGSAEIGEAHYYRIEGPTMVIEYDNAQNEANHIHVVWRDPTNDFGEDYLKRHYETADADHGHSH